MMHPTFFTSWHTGLTVWHDYCYIYSVTNKNNVIMKYEVEVTRISYATITVTVDAESKDEAEELAMDEAYNTSFDEDSADYQIESCISVDDDDEEESEEEED